jgi:proline iminopeptidase
LGRPLSDFPTHPQAHDHFLDVPGARLYVRQVGAGPTLIALHGGPDFNHNYLLPELDALAPPFRLVYYDQRGRGRSSEGVTPADVSLQSELDDLDRLRRHLGLEAVALLGHSFGALLAMEYAALHPQRVGHLILMNPAPGSHADLTRFRRNRAEREAATLARMREIAGTPAYAEGDIQADTLYYLAHFAAAVRRPELVGTIVARLRSHFTPSGILAARAIEARLYEMTWLNLDYDVVARLAKSPRPTLVIHGEQDFVPVQCAVNVANAIAGAHLTVLEDCGHFAFLEHPRRVRELIRSFVLAE